MFSPEFDSQWRLWPYSLVVERLALNQLVRVRFPVGLLSLTRVQHGLMVKWISFHASNMTFWVRFLVGLLNLASETRGTWCATCPQNSRQGVRILRWPLRANTRTIRPVRLSRTPPVLCISCNDCFKVRAEIQYQVWTGHHSPVDYWQIVTL